AAHDLRALVRSLRAEARTILLTTHDMAEAEAICDRVTMIDGGRLLGTEDPRTIGTWISAYERVDARPVSEELATALAALDGVAEVERIGDSSVRVHTAAEGATQAALRILVEAGVTTISTGRPSLEEVYLHVVGARGLAV